MFYFDTFSDIETKEDLAKLKQDLPFGSHLEETTLSEELKELL